MDRIEALERDSLYNTSLTAFLGALLMLLARNVSYEDSETNFEWPVIQRISEGQDWVSPHLSSLHLPLSAILLVIAFTLLVFAMFPRYPRWALPLSEWFSLLTPMFAWVGLLISLLPLVGDLFPVEPHLGVFVLCVAFVFLVLITARAFFVLIQFFLNWGRSTISEQDHSA